MESLLIERAQARLRSAPADQRPEITQAVLRELTVSENNAARRVGATMNLLGELKAVSIEAPDLEFEPSGWEWRAAALSELVNTLHQRVAALRGELTQSGPYGDAS